MIEMKSQREDTRKKDRQHELEMERHTVKAWQQKRDEGKGGKKERERNREDESVL